MAMDHPLEELIGLRSLLDDKCVRDLERMVALHAQAQANAGCDDTRVLALIEVVLATWLFERVSPRAAGTNNDALTSVVLDPGPTAQRLAWTDDELDIVVGLAERSGRLLVEEHLCGSQGLVYIVDFLPLIAPSSEALRLKLERSWRTQQFRQICETWREANQELEWIFADFDRGSPLAPRMAELERVWFDLASRAGGSFEFAALPRDLETLYLALESLGRIQEEVMALSGAGEIFLSAVLAKQAHFRAQHRRQTALAGATVRN